MNKRWGRWREKGRRVRRESGRRRLKWELGLGISITVNKSVIPGECILAIALRLYQKY